MITASLPIKKIHGEGFSLLRWLLRRDLPQMGVFFALSLLVLPVPYILAVSSSLSWSLPAPAATPARIFTGLSMKQFCWLVPAAALLLALAQAWWLRSKRASEFWHSLPVRRDTLLLANAGAAWLTIALPLLADYLIVMIAGAVRLAMKRPELDHFLLPVGEILLDLLGWLSVSLAIVAMVFLVSVMTGRLLETAAFGAVLFLGPPAAALVTDLAVNRFLVGWYGSRYAPELFLYSSPLFAMPMRYRSYNTFDGTYSPLGNWVLLLWLCLGLLCLWLACRLFRSRPTESAGAGGVREPLGAVGALLGVFVGGLLLGLVVWDYCSGVLPFTPVVLLCSLGMAAAVVLILNRGLRGFRKRLPLLAFCVLLPGLAALIVTTGGLGYETRIPAPEAAAPVLVRYRGRYGSLAQRLDHEAESIEQIFGPSRSYTYGIAQQVTLLTPEGVQAAEALHQSLFRIQKEQGEGRQSMSGAIDFIYSSGLTRVYGQRRGNGLYGGFRELEPLLALEENLEFRQQTDPRFTLDAGEVRAIRVSDATGLVTNNPITDEENIQRLLTAMKADAEAFDYTAFREGTARAVAYLSVETIAPASSQWVSEPITRDLWRDFCLPVYQEDQNTLNALWALGQGELTGRFLGRERITELRVSWWGDAAWNQEVYWTGTGPRDLWEGERDAVWENAVTLTVTDPAKVTQLLDLTLGADCHISEEGFLVTVFGEHRQGSTFWLSREDAPQEVLDWYAANEREIRGYTRTQWIRP